VLIRCWGSRGSIPVSGKSYLKYGGDTTCIELRTKNDDSIDEVEDLAEVLLHGKGQAANYLKKLGFNIMENGGRVGVKRE